jgi:hypothetical protein
VFGIPGYGIVGGCFLVAGQPRGVAHWPYLDWTFPATAGAAAYFVGVAQTGGSPVRGWSISRCAFSGSQVVLVSPLDADDLGLISYRARLQIMVISGPLLSSWRIAGRALSRLAARGYAGGTLKVQRRHPGLDWNVAP